MDNLGEGIESVLRGFSGQLPQPIQFHIDEQAKKEYKGSSGGGIIEVVVNGMCRAKSCKIDRDLCAKLASDPEFVEDMIVGAMRDAVEKAQQGLATHWFKH